MHKNSFKLLVIAVIIGFSLVSCSTKHQENMKFSSRMKDGGRCVFEVKMTSDSEESIARIVEKKQRINHALNLILFEYKTGQLEAKGKGSVRKILLRIIQTTSKVSEVDIEFVSFEVLSP